MVPLVVIFDKTSKQEILRKNIEIGTIFEVGTRFGVILHFVWYQFGSKYQLRSLNTLPGVVILGQTSMQEIPVNNVEVGTIFEAGSSFEVI